MDRDLYPCASPGRLTFSLPWLAFICVFHISHHYALPWTWSSPSYCGSPPYASYPFSNEARLHALYFRTGSRLCERLRGFFSFFYRGSHPFASSLSHAGCRSCANLFISSYSSPPLSTTSSIPPPFRQTSHRNQLLREGFGLSCWVIFALRVEAPLQSLHTCHIFSFV